MSIRSTKSLAVPPCQKWLLIWTMLLVLYQKPFLEDYKLRGTSKALTMQPKDLQIFPLKFGSFNISWTAPTEGMDKISHYELVLVQLAGEIPSSSEQTRCAKFLNTHNLTVDRSAHQRQIDAKELRWNISTSKRFMLIHDLPPDRFYRVFLYANSDLERGVPASMPSSPRVPSLAPPTPPEEVRVTARGTQEAKVSWKPPSGADCTGELMNYVLTVNSSRLIEPLVIKVPGTTKSYVIKDLIPGTIYTFDVAATTRGGVGRRAKRLRFRTDGETPRFDLGETDDSEMERMLFPEGGEGGRDGEDELQWTPDGARMGPFYDADSTTIRRSEWMAPDPMHEPYMVPAKIHNLRAYPTRTSIQLRWSVALRHVSLESERELVHRLAWKRKQDAQRNSATTNHESLRVSLTSTAEAELTEEDGAVGLLPPGTKYLIRWGDTHPGPMEDTVMGDRTEYLIEKLRPSTIYYIRVIAVTLLGDGPAAYTVAMTLGDSTDHSTPSKPGLVIPINLAVRAVGSSWARVGWELPEMPSRRDPKDATELLFQIKYYAIPNGPSTRAPSQRQPKAHIQLTNVSVPWSSQLTKQSKDFKAILRGLDPGTPYEFGVRLQPSALDNSMAISTESFWSMVQGFETLGQTELYALPVPRTHRPNPGPSDAPGSFRITFQLTSTDEMSTDGLNSLTSPDLASLTDDAATDDNNALRYTAHLFWSPPSRTNGPLLVYHLFVINDRTQAPNRWLERTVPAEEPYLKLHGLAPNQYYFFRVLARNRHGSSPPSAVNVFRTPDANDQNGGLVKLSKTYFTASNIDEPLDRIIPPGSDEKRHGSLDGAATSPSVSETPTDQLRWIVIGSVLGGTVVISLVAVIVLCNRCRRSSNSLSMIKRHCSKQSYISAYPALTPTDANRTPIDMNVKPVNYHLTDACLGTCSLSGSAAGGSNTGLLTSIPMASSDVSPMDPRLVYDPSGACHATQLLQSTTCACSDWCSKSRTCGWPSNGVHPHMMPSNSAIGSSTCPDDRHSTPAGSDNGVAAISSANTVAGCGGSIGSCPSRAAQDTLGLRLGRQMSARQRSDMEECGHYPIQRSTGAGDQTLGRLTPDNCPHGNRANCGGPGPVEMTVSYLAADAHPRHLQTAQPGIPYRFGPTRVTRHGNFDPCEHVDGSPDLNFVHLRHVSNAMVGFTGSGSFNEDDPNASSPASSSIGHRSVTAAGVAGMARPANASPVHGALRGMWKYGSPPQPHLSPGIPQAYPTPPAAFRTQSSLGGKTTEPSSPQSGLSFENPGQTCLDGKVRRYGELNRKLTEATSPSQRRAFGMPTRINAMSSDYASQQSSEFSNPSSASSAAGQGLSPDHPASNTSPPIVTDPNRLADVSLSFALDRVPTPEPTPRPAPFSRLATGELNHEAQQRINQKHGDAGGPFVTVLPNKLSREEMSSNMARKTMTTGGTLGDFLHEPTQDSIDSVSEKGMIREYSAEELNQEMANLEGLMKDLNRITQNQFEC